MISQIGLLDPSLKTRNMGDHVIVESAKRELPELKSARKIASHGFPSFVDANSVRASKSLVFAGTNVLGPYMWRHRQFPSIGVLNPLMRKKTAYLGVGWGAPAQKLDGTTAKLLRGSMMPGLPIGVRDTYTLSRLKASGIPAVFISCPTTWSLQSDLPAWEGIDEVVTTMTDYRPDTEADNALLKFLCGRFSRVIIWLQGANDGNYTRQLELPRNVVVDADASLENFTKILAGRGYIGTRLHGGIHALQNGRPTGIAAVDHRATSLGSDIGLPVVERNASMTSRFDEMINSHTETHRITLPLDAIQEWTTNLRSRLGTSAFG